MPVKQRYGCNCSGSFMLDVDGTVKPLLDRDLSSGDADSASVGFELVRATAIADGVVVGHFAGGPGTEDGAQVETLGNRSKGPEGIARLDSEASCVLGDEHTVEVVGGFIRVGDVVVVEFCYEPVLKRAVDTFTPAAGLWAVSEDQLYRESVHGDLKVGGFIVTLEDMGAAMAGGSELAGFVEVQGLREAVTPGDLVENTEAAVKRLLRVELTVQGHAGGVVGGEDEGALG